jgi:ketosteroid isomerase-like protein
MQKLMHRRAVLGSAAATVFAVITRAGAQPASGRSAKDVLADAERSFADSMARRDLVAFASYVSEEAVFFGGTDGNTPLRGRAAIVDGWKRFFNGPAAPFSWSPDSAEVLASGTLGATSGPVKDEKGTLTGRFNSVWRLERDGNWRVIFDRGCQVCRCPG